MPNTIRNARTVRFEPHGLVDAIDGTRAPPGSMWRLKDLVPSPSMDRVFVPRPGSTEASTFIGFAGATRVTALKTIGNMAYGFLSSGTFSGKDEPFVYNMATAAFVTIAGETSSNVPATQSTSGDWTPPTIDQVGSRIVFTHPGFPSNGGGVVPGFTQFMGNTTASSPTITTAPLNGLIVGQRLVAGAHLGVGATISSVAPVQVQTTGTGTNGSPSLTVGSATGLFPGMLVTLADGSVAGLYIDSITGTTVTLSGNINGNPTAVAAYFYGTEITASVNSASNSTGTTIWAISGGEATNFGWLDVSGYSQIGSVNYTGQPFLTGNFPIAGVQPGMTVTGPNISGNTTVLATQNVVIDSPYGNTTSGDPVVEIVPTSAQVAGGFTPAVGMEVAGAGIPNGTVVLAVSYANWPIITLTLSNNATATASFVALTLIGTLIAISSTPSGGAAVNQMVTIAGGTPSSPLWGAGDTTLTPLSARPAWVAQFNGRAWYGVNPTDSSPGVTFSDGGFPCQQSNVVAQTLTFNDGLPSTIGAGLQLNNQLGGIVQSLLISQGQGNWRQITGDIATNNLFMNTLNVAAGTIAPLSLASTPLGLMFAASDGLRYIDFNGNIQGPIGTRGRGLCLPFINATTPTRAAAAYNENIYRITLTWTVPPSAQQQWGTGSRTDEFWFHLDLGIWSGPHSFTALAIQPWDALNSFITVPIAVPASMWESDPVPTNGSVYLENGAAMTYDFKTAYLPDNPEGMANCIVEGTMFYQLPTNTSATVTVTDDESQTLDTLSISQATQTTAAQRSLKFHNPLIFRQAVIDVAGNSDAAVQLGALSPNIEQLGYRYTSP